MAKRAKLEPIEGQLPVTLARAAELAKVTEKTIRTWVAAGMPVLQQGKKGRGSITIVDLQDVLRTAMEQDALDIARTRRESAQADRIEMDNALRRAELADVRDVAREWSDMVLAFRSKMLSLPAKLAAQVTNVADTAVVAAAIRTEVNAALAELAVSGGGSEGTQTRRRKSGEAAAGSDGQPVGRRKAKAVERSIS